MTFRPAVTARFGLLLAFATLTAPSDARAQTAPCHDLAPDFPAVLRRTLEEAGLQHERTSDARLRARLRGLLPDIRLGIRRGLGQDASFRAGATEGSNLSLDENLSFEGTLRFDLGRLVFAREEPGLLRERRAFRLDRHEAIREVVHIYFERQRLIQELAQGLGTEAQRTQAEWTVRQNEALLDAWTGHAFEGCWRNARVGRNAPSRSRQVDFVAAPDPEPPAASHP